MSLVDWGYVIASAITGAVGVAGIAGSIGSAWLGRKSATENLTTSIAAEDQRAIRAEKRRIYAKCLATLTAYTQATAGDDRSRAALAMYSAVQEVVLVGPLDLANLVVDVEGHARNKRPEFSASFAALTDAMRMDLDE